MSIEVSLLGKISKTLVSLNMRFYSLNNTHVNILSGDNNHKLIHNCYIQHPICENRLRNLNSIK